MSKDVQKVGRICYVEPNGFNSDGEALSHNTQIPHQYENYCIGVDLLVDTRSRYDFIGEDKEIEKVTRRLAHFIGGRYDQSGTTWYLTTDYSDYSERNIIKGDNHESIGITNISIKYECYGYPDVDITFEDIRGSSLMIPEEAGLYKQLISDSKHGYSDVASDMKSGSFFKSLLSFPPPVFYLRIKGFYGDGITLKLANERAKFTFDSNSGNFKIDVHFIGYQYGILVDMPFSLCYVAPLTKTGKGIWDECIENGTYHYYGDGVVKTPDVYKTLLSQISKIEKECLQSFDNEDSVQRLNDMEAKKVFYTELLNGFPFRKWTYIGGRYYTYIETDNADKEREFEAEIANSLNNEYNNTILYGDNFESNTLDSLLTFLTKNINLTKARYPYFKYIAVTRDGSLTATSDENSELLELYKEGDSTFKAKADAVNSESTKLYVYATEKGSCEFSYKLEKLIKDLNDVIESQADVIADAELRVVSNYLGFEPSIKNINQVLFCHFDTFIQMFFRFLDEISTQVKNGNRRVSKYIKSPNDSDINTEDCGFIPPFPLFTKEVSSESGTKRINLWPVEYDSRLFEMPEVQFVYELIAATDGNGVYDDFMEKEKDAYDKSEQNESNRTVLNYIPLTFNDIVKLCKNNMATNPYEFIKYVLTGEISSWLYSTFMSRELFFELSNEIRESYDSFDIAKSIGAIEATNVFMALNDKYELEELFKTGTDNISAYMFDCMSSDNFYNSSGEYYWVTSNKNNLFIPIGLFDEESIYSYRQSENRSSVSKDFLNLNKLDVDKYYEIDSAAFNSLYSNVETVKTSNGNEVSYMFAPLVDTIEYGLIDDRYKTNDGYTFKKEYMLSFDNLNTDINLPISFTSLYYKPGISLKARAYLFLMSLSTNGENGFMDNILYSGFRTGVDILCEGAASWRLAEYESTGEDPLKCEKDEIPSPYNTPRRKFDEKRFGMGLGYYYGDEELYKIGDKYYKKSTLGYTDKDIYYSYNDLISNKNENYIFLYDGAIKFDSEVLYVKKSVEILNFRELDKPVCKITLSSFTATTDTVKIKSGYYVLSTSVEYDDIRLFEIIPERINENWFENKERQKIALSEFEKFVSGPFVNIDKAISIYKKDGNVISYEDFSSKDVLNIDNILKYNNKCFKLIDENKPLEIKSNSCGTYYITNLEFVEHEMDGYHDSKFFEIKTKMSPYLSFKKLHIDMALDNVGTAIYNKNLINKKVGNVDFRNIAWREFINKLKELYSDKKERSQRPDNNTARIDQSNGEDKSNSNDLRLSTYLLLKNLYEKWICNTDIKSWRLTDTEGEKSQYTFMYIDSYHRDISNKLMVNLESLNSRINGAIEKKDGRFNSTSVYGVLGDTAVNSHCLFFSLPFMFGQTNNDRELSTLFDAKRIEQCKFYDKSSFVTMYSYSPSGKLDIGKNSEFKNDGFDLADTLGNIHPILPVALSSENMHEDYILNDIPAFGVTYAKQSQSYFTEIKLDTNTPTESEYTIISRMNIAGSASRSQMSSSIYGQDIYRIFSNYAYRTTIKMLGNAMITPLMYFQLNNIPMWKGAYIIDNVTHSISPGDMSTTFSGYRLCKYANRLVTPLPISTTLRDAEKKKIASLTGGTEDTSGLDVLTMEIRKSRSRDNNYWNLGIIGNSRYSKEHVEDKISSVFNVLRNVNFNYDRILTANNEGELIGRDNLYVYLLSLSIANIVSNPNVFVVEGSLNSDYLNNITTTTMYSIDTRGGIPTIKDKATGPESGYYPQLINRLIGSGVKVLNTPTSNKYFSGKEVENILINNSNFKEGDIVLYWYEGTNTMLIQRGSNPTLPGHAQIYHEHVGSNGRTYHWVSSTKNNENNEDGFIYQKGDDNDKKWRLIVMGVRT